MGVQHQVVRAGTDADGGVVARGEVVMQRQRDGPVVLSADDQHGARIALLPAERLAPERAANGAARFHVEAGNMGRKLCLRNVRRKEGRDHRRAHAGHVSGQLGQQERHWPLAQDAQHDRGRRLQR